MVEILCFLSFSLIDYFDMAGKNFSFFLVTSVIQICERIGISELLFDFAHFLMNCRDSCI